MNCLNKNVIDETRCDTEALSIDRELNNEHFYGKIMQKMYIKC